MYNLTRQDVADKLNISTRSVDRYIKAGKLRSEKQGKVVYVNSEDVSNMVGGTSVKHEVIMPEPKPEQAKVTTEKSVSTNNNTALDKVYSDLKREVREKDEKIQELAINLGRAQEIAKNSVSLIDFKKSQFLLEESKGHLSKELDRLEDEKIKLTKDLKYEKNSNMILVAFVILLIIVSAIIFFVKI